MSFAWNTHNITEVATLLKQGLSAAQIGEQLGISRNAVIGKVGRDEGLSRIGFAWTRAQHFAGKNPERLKVKTLNFKSDKPRRMKRQTHIISDALPFQVAGKTLLMLGSRDCRWVVNDAVDDQEHLFCSCHAENGKSFCNYHQQKAFQTPSNNEGIVL